MKNVKIWIKNHKKELLIGGAVVAGAALIIVGVAENDLCKEFAVDLEKIAIKDLGNTGKRFLAAIPNVTENTPVNVIAYIEKADII